MSRVRRTTTFIAALFIATTASGQVLPGVSYNPKRHPNPVVTYIKTSDFKKTTYDEARKLTEFDPLGLSAKEGERKSIEIALQKPTTQRINLPDDEFPQIKVEFYPVVRQNYVLKSGVALILDAFRFPKVPIPMNDMTGILNGAAFRPGDQYWQARFGPATVPERVTVRGVAALLFDDNNEFVLFWREGTHCYVIKTKAPRSDLFRIAADLL
jgi:hypothetical protein